VLPPDLAGPSERLTGAARPYPCRLGCPPPGSGNKSFLLGSLGRCVAGSADVLTRGASREPVEALMNPTALIAMLAAVNNGWAFAAFVALLAVSIYFGRRDAP